MLLNWFTCTVVKYRTCSTACLVQKSGHPIYFCYNFSKLTPILTKTIYAFYWLKYWLKGQQLIRLWSCPGKGPVAWHPSKMSSSPMDTSAGRCPSAYGPYYHGLSEEREDWLHRVGPTCGPQTAPTWTPWTTLFGVPFSRESTADEKLTQWKNWCKQ